MFRLNKTSRTLLILAGMISCGWTTAFAADAVTIAVVRDGPGYEEQFVRDVEAELHQLLREQVNVTFDTSTQYTANWEGDQATAALRAALAAPGVDIILGLGPVVTLAAAAPDMPLTRPFVSSYVGHSDIDDLPVAEGRSLKPGFNMMALDGTLARDIASFRGLVPFDTLCVAFSGGARMADRIVEYGRRNGIHVIPVDMPASVESALDAVPENARAVMLLTMSRFSEQQRQDLIAGLTARHIATFSMLGHPDVELGALAAMTPDLTRQRARRVALNLSRLIGGEPVESLPVALSVEPKLLINARTAAAVGYEPDMRTRNLAEFVHADELDQAPELTFRAALDLAEENNISLAIADADVERSLRDKQRARSPLLPQVVTQAAYGGNHPTIDTPLLPDEITTAGFQVNQMIYDDRVVTNFRSSGRLHEGQQQQRESERLDVMADAGNAFLQFAAARVLMRVSADDVRLTEDNLKLSRVRFSAGLSGREEVLRWESVLASRRSELLQRDADVETAGIALNQVLGIDQNRRWLPQEMDVDTQARNFWLGRMAPVFQHEQRTRVLTEAFVNYAIENAPELKALDFTSDAIDIQVSRRKRSFILPSFLASFSYDYIIDRSPSPPPGARSDDYSFRIAAVYPLFVGGDKYYDMKSQQAQLRAVKGEREFVRQQIEQRTRTAIRRAGTSFATIELVRKAADNSKQNLDIVQSKYSQGLVDVTDLLSAQNDFFSADQNAKASVYLFLIDLVELQRSISWFEEDKTPAEQDAFYEHMREASASAE